MNVMLVIVSRGKGRSEFGAWPIVVQRSRHPAAQFMFGKRNSMHRRGEIAAFRGISGCLGNAHIHTAFPALPVQTGWRSLGVVLSSVVGLFFRDLPRCGLNNYPVVAPEVPDYDDHDAVRSPGDFLAAWRR